MEKQVTKIVAVKIQNSYLKQEKELPDISGRCEL